MNINQISLASQKTENGQENTYTLVQNDQTADKVNMTGRFSKQSRFINQLSQSSGVYGRNVAEEEEKTDTGTSAKSALECFQDVQERLTENDAQDLEDEGMSLEKYESQRLDRALDRIKKNRQAKRESIDDLVEKGEDQEKDIKKTAVKNAVSNHSSNQTEAVLANANLPMTTENIDKINQAMDMAGNVENLDEDSIQYLMSNQLEPTIANVYKAVYSSADNGNTVQNNNLTEYESVNIAYDIDGSGIQKSTESDWEAVKEQAVSVINEANMDVTDDTLRQCKWLFDNHLPVTADNLKKINGLENLQNNYSENDVLETVVKNYETGTKPEDTLLVTNNTMDGNEQVDAFLQQVQQELSSKESTINDVASRRQLEEIRLKMTSEAGQTLLSKGITLDISNLSEIVDGLKQIEQDYYKDMANEGQDEVSDESAQILWETSVKVNELGSMPENVLALTFSQRNIQTVNSLYETGTSVRNTLEKAGESYEALRTEVRQDLGDSYKKAFASIDPILEDMGMEKTDANRQAVRILGYNGIEITEDSIAEMKNYDSKVQQLMDGLKPAVTLEMIKRGINPLEMPIDEVNQQIDQVNQEIGSSDDEKYSEFLWKLDQKKNISTEDRQSFIGLYRIVKQVSKSDGAAIGSVVKAGQDMTLGNLLAAVRTAKSGGIDKTVDDSFGISEDASDNMKANTDSVSEQIDYYQRAAGSILNNMTPDNLQAVSEEVNSDIQDGMLDVFESLQDVSIETLKESIDKKETNSTDSKKYSKEKLDFYYGKINDAQNCTELLQNSNLPVTLENMASASSLLYENVWEEISDSAMKETSDKESFKQSSEQMLDSLGEDSFSDDYESFTETLKTTMEENISNEDNSYSDVSMYRFMGSSLELTGLLAKRESYYIPVVTGNKFANVNVTVEHSKNNMGKAKVSYQSEDLGSIESEWSVKDNVVKGFVTADNVSALDLLEQQSDLVEGMLNDIGLSTDQVHYSLNQNRNLKVNLAEKPENSVDTKVLLNVAKLFIKSVQVVEQIKERG